uniref:Flavin reductase (NADPH) n=1 Tax=Lentzea aerocolonigenes TaxID=68170 RepID=REBF_LENAE|nr:RecName: Full=Flavin reductase (NADPH); AltName: Full=Flavin dependent oxidoreductase; AltName: Full=Flavin:NAD(P)H reductase [Lentzea aerocolonigenes]QTU90780.1 reductase [Cloning vector pTU3-A-RebFHOD_VioCDE_KanR]AAN01214.1 flavin dependent oxidoreductase [Lentzea aerocolonigenes]CAC93720.1 putative flavin reductase [Lentzea aerocolonigenes]BAC10680.1 putative NADH oxidoreductase [Lentzea aerocolonigenes]BAC15756.1 flavin reductase [Lentzea aerocolonigenes]
MTIEFDRPGAHVTAADHRALMSLFPTGVAVITAIDEAGTPHGMTCTSLTSVTLDPPTLLVCLNRASGTLHAVRGGRFGVNLLHARGRRAAEVFSTAVQDRFGEVRWEHSDVTGMPWLAEDAHAFAGCVVRKSTVVGDHEIVLGEVHEVVREHDLPLLYGMREFAVWTPEG